MINSRFYNLCSHFKNGIINFHYVFAYRIYLCFKVRKAYTAAKNINVPLYLNMCPMRQCMSVFNIPSGVADMTKASRAALLTTTQII